MFSQFNLTTALYAETDTHAMAGVIVRTNSTYKNLQGIGGVRACINEYHGIGKRMCYVKCSQRFVSIFFFIYIFSN